MGTAFLRTKEWEDAINSFEVVFDLEQSSFTHHGYMAWGGLALAYDGLNAKHEVTTVVETILESDFAKGVSKERKQFQKTFTD